MKKALRITQHKTKIFTFFLVALFLLPLVKSQDVSGLETIAEKILLSISEIRELVPLRQVSKGVLSREEIEGVFRQRIDQDFVPEDLENERQLLVKLGVLPREYDYLEGALEVLNEQVAGFYDPQEKTLFIADWLSPEIQQMTMAHELTHALQDQHYDLEAILSPSDRNGDALMARRSIVEGDAVAVMFDYLLTPMNQSFVNLPNIKDLYQQTLEMQSSGTVETQQLQEAPPFIRDSLLFPYIYGARFMQVYRRSNSWQQSRVLYASLPTSTEQILHPEKFLVEKDDPADFLSVVSAGLAEWEIAYADTFGEFQTQLTLREFLGEEKAIEASTGWDGDRIRLLRDDEGRRALQWDTIWDTAEDARQFFDAYSQLIQVKYRLGPAESQGLTLVWETEFDRIELIQNDLSVQVTEIEKIPARLQ